MFKTKFYLPKNDLNYLRFLLCKRLNSLGLQIYHTRTWGVTITTRMFPRKKICKNETRKRVFWNSVSCHKHFLCDIFYSGDTITKRRCDSVGQGEITAIFLLLGFRTECKFLRRSMLYWALSRFFVLSIYKTFNTYLTDRTLFYGLLFKTTI